MRGATALAVAICALAAPHVATAAQDLNAAANTLRDAACVMDRSAAQHPAASLPDGFIAGEVKTARAPGRPPRTTIAVMISDTLGASLQIDGLGMPRRRISVTLHDSDLPRLQILAQATGSGMDAICATFEARRIDYRDGQAQQIVLLNPQLAETGNVIALNPPVPPGTDPGGVTLAHIDSGVNYLLPQIATALARDDTGQSLGRDFWDDDARPFDGDRGRSAFFPLHHGTTVASLLLAEAPRIRLVPLRYPRSDMSLMADVVRHAADSGARIVAMPMGSRSRSDWEAFETAARARPGMLFIVSAGNDGRNIDADPLYPAALDLPNMLVVTSADDFGRLARGSNWGVNSVDLMVPAEGIDVTDHRGATVSASGSSYAVPRVAALAARLLLANPDWTTNDLIAAISALAAPGMDRGGPKVAVGWIPDPLHAP